MAQIPTTDQIKNIQNETQKEIDKKTKSQIKKGKNFIPHDGGVIPEKIWKSMKGPKND